MDTNSTIAVPPAVLAPRVCFAAMKQVNNPVCSFNAMEPLCGRATRKDVDAVTQDKELVTCDGCKAVLSNTPPGQEPQAVAPQASAALVTIPAQQPGLPEMIAAMDVPRIEAMIADLNGELAALKVLLKAAKARDKARKEPVVESE